VRVLRMRAPAEGSFRKSGTSVYTLRNPRLETVFPLKDASY